ncbi:MULTISPECIES: efflux transporter outer membrane subunit [Ramlibacter]|uniref:Efflux transporter outer membrane subunit n=1 Tax=Ramlibacter aquaticus TaxID=2780094 RepID=A0ABR9SGZ2_9BURK|nr:MULTISPECIES: efflux transporter outer membrane subunit [Ramlibacter]MBE7941459.1 efflux transporter outer membrane subunit [Ramlibacter aquaticus]
MSRRIRRAAGRPATALGLVAATLLAAGCSFAPTYQRPAAPVAPAYPYAGAAQGQPAADIRWQDFFQDPTLRQLVATALANNRDLRVAVLNVEQARAQADIRRADLFPTVSAAVTGNRAPKTATPSLYTAGFTVSAWEIDLWGRLRNLGDAAVAQYLATTEGRNAAQASLVASVASTWLLLLADEEQLALTRDTLRTREESLRLTRLRFENGAASELDARQAESLAESARATLAQLSRQRATDLDALGLLLGQPVPENVAAGRGTAGVTLPDLPAGAPSDLLARRPDVRQAEQQLIAANANIGAARAAYFPRIALTASVGSASTALDNLFKGGTWGWTAAPSLVETVFDAGRNRANVAAATAGRDIAIAQYEKAIQSAFREVADALAGRATYGEQLAAQQKVVEAETVRMRLSQLRYDNGVSSYLDLLDAQRSLFAAQQQLIQVRLAQLQNQVQLYRALGGGWYEGDPASS